MNTENLDSDIPLYAVAEAEKAGAEYAEARLQAKKDIMVAIRNGQQEPIVTSESFGLGVRVIKEGGLAFSATNVLDKENIRLLVEQTVKKAQATSTFVQKGIKFSRERKAKRKWRAQEKDKLEDKNFEDIMKILRELDNIILLRRDYIPMRILEMDITIDEKILSNTQGTFIQGYVPRIYVEGFLTGMKEGKMAQKSIEYGGSGGWEIIETLKIREEIQHETDVIKQIIEKGRAVTPGNYDIVTGSEVTGIMAHESIGHPFEADRILGREAAQAGESYLKSSDIGRKIGDNEVNVSDDPTIPNSYGFYLYDEEGIPAKKRRLVVNGIVNELLHNRGTAREFGTKSNGSSRASAFDREPIVRMANTFVEPGSYSFEELIREVKNGIYMNSFMEWNIDDTRWNQRYVGHESYLIEKGEIRAPIVNPIIEITTERLWGSLDARGKDLRFWAATCGKGDPMQGAPVWAGGPNLRFKNMMVKTR